MNLRSSKASRMVFFHRNSKWITQWTQTVAMLDDPTLEIVPIQDVDWVEWVKRNGFIDSLDCAENSVGYYLLCEGNPEGIAAFGRQALGQWGDCEKFNEVSDRIFQSFRTILWVSEEDGTKNRYEMAKLLGRGVVDVWSSSMDGEELRYRLMALLRREEMLLRLRRAAMVDFLTGLPTRRAFEMTAVHSIAAAQRMRASCCVAMVDLDRFKDVNDRYHHAVGDELLCEFARRLRRYSRKSDFYARWGGDEFVYFLVHTNLEDAYRWAERMQKIWTRPVTIEGREISLSVSVGIAPLPCWNVKPLIDSRETFSERTPEWWLKQMLREADAAMYREKREKYRET